MLLFCFMLLGFSQKKIIDFFRIQKCKNGEEKFMSPQGKIIYWVLLDYWVLCHELVVFVFLHCAILCSVPHFFKIRGKTTI